MAEGGVGNCPQVFVVDAQPSYISMPREKASRWARLGQNCLLLLVGVTMLGLIVEGCFIYRLYKTMEVSKYHPVCQNLSQPQTSGLQGGPIMSNVGTKDTNEIPTVPPHLDLIQNRPFAQLIGAIKPSGQNNTVLWENNVAETVTHNMGYNNGLLLVEQGGYYHLYSKLTLRAAEKSCSLIQHKVMKKIVAYDKPIELMSSKSVRCRTQSCCGDKASGGEDLWSSFLAGIFHLQSGDKIFVTLENINTIRPGPTDNLMGAFMIFPGNIPL
uniref:THD domain-containing protein n=1 Tax=Gasterosteus aculeatus aculeatus TaxID=481459 RepID=A0AAQ4NZR4_GASAC|nr:tumor necrosis factor ligand superfamily member 14-like [Gasterosteus aculeatus aculeatus]XP_040041890.1 tumor necrosis factor ligand superfamily member 14-like [Gasterosteus aculeatus aculeatus]